MKALTRYGAPCATCAVVRDYHDLTPKDHAYAPRQKSEPPMNADHAAYLVRQREDAEREDRKREAYARPIVYADSEDPTTGLQPPIGSHDAWEAEGRRRPGPRCTGCGAHLDPAFCDPDARARAAEYDARQRAYAVKP